MHNYTRSKQRPPSRAIAHHRQGEAVQRMAEEEDLLQGKFASLQRMEEEDLLQGKFDGPVQRKVAPMQFEESPAPANKTGMPGSLKAGVESLSGMDMSDVRVHYNSAKPATVQAHAYTQGTDIHIGPGQERHLAHESWHVAQQKAGRVKPTTEVNGLPVNDSPSLEREADVMGAKAMRF